MERTYIPGTCNLSDAEVRGRAAAGWFGVLTTIALGMFFYFTGATPFMKLFIFLPAYIGAIGLLQSAMHFCVSFAMSGVFNVSNEVGKTESVSRAEFRAADKKKAISIFLYSFLIAALVTVVSILM